jgi:hypothetical protein
MSDKPVEWSGMTMKVEIPLPMVEGEPSIQTDDVYDDSVDVYVEQGAYGQPCATLRLCPAGPCEFVLLGFDPAGLRQLARFLEDAARELEHEVKQQTTKY